MLTDEEVIELQKANGIELQNACGCSECRERDRPKIMSFVRAVIAAYEAKLREQNESIALPFAILDEELQDLHRFHECASDGEGYDVPKERMKCLAEIGLVRRVTANVYEHTTFGLSVINGDFTHPAQIPEGFKKIADLAFDTLNKPASGYYEGLKLIMDTALAARGGK